LNSNYSTIGLLVGICFIQVCSVEMRAAESFAFFEKRIRPLFINHCLTCHSGSESAGDLRLDLKSGWENGGTRGAAIVPFKPEESLLFQVVSGAHSKLRMPRDSDALTAEQIADLTKWIRTGAPDPRDGSTYQPPFTKPGDIQNHWAFRPIERPSLPDVSRLAWTQTPIDRFVLKRLEDAGLPPAVKADRRTLIRRLYFDLVGHPPTPRQVQEFVELPGDGSVDRLIDQLLASPQYGERWARHWLDVSRYSDTAGYREVGKQRRYLYSYTYRDYVIGAFNQDLPFDHFVREQLAADMMANVDAGSLAALGFLTLGPVFLGNNDLVIDDRIDVVTRGLMGLSVQCARCHDHKYDPIPTADYYSLYGVFASTEEMPEKPLLGMQPEPLLRRSYLQEQARRQAAYESLRAEEVEKAQHRIRSKIGDYMVAVHEKSDQELVDPGRDFFRLRSLNPRIFAQVERFLTNGVARPHRILEPWLLWTSFGIDVKQTAEQMGALQNDSRINPAVRSFLVPAPSSLRELADRYNRLARQVDSPEVAEESAREEFRQFLRAPASPFTAPDSEHDILVQLAREKLNVAEAYIESLDATHPGAPRRAQALVEKEMPVRPSVFIRGSNRQRGKRVPRQFLEFLEGPNRRPFRNGSGRLELAEAILNPQNPLTARVFVNRVWMHHFGQPLVDSPSDFGVRANPPTHPELLDWLATEFISSGWSVKHLHRLILRSATYQQSGDSTERAVGRDPENRLLGRMSRRRMDFESIRDSMLQVSGSLNLRVEGQSFDLTKTPAINRRAVYGFVDRSEVAGLLKNFDFATPDTSSPRRFETTVPQQSLFLMNSPFILDAASRLSASLPTAPDTERINRMYQRAFQRDPTGGELRDAREFLSRRGKPLTHATGGGWEYGVGEFDAEQGVVKDFEKFSHFTGDVWQEGESLPSPKWKYARLSADGGHPGPNVKYATVRRWIPPGDGEVSVSGEISHQRRGESDGVRGHIVTREEVHWTGIAQGNTVAAKVPTIKVRRGEPVNFVAVCRVNHNGDLFLWNPRIEYLHVAPGESGVRRYWEAANDFGPLPEAPPQPPNRWSQLAQILLMSNEMLFVD
jgi:hypothetical protein